MATDKDKAKLLALLKDSLTLEVRDGDFTNPNQRILILKFDGEIIDQVSFDVVQKREYEG